MKKTYVTSVNFSKKFDTYEEAEVHAKRHVGLKNPISGNVMEEVTIFVSMAQARAPIPEVEVVKIS